MQINFASLLAAGVLAAVYALRGEPGEEGVSARFWSRRRWISAAAGVSVGYVFVDVLPELAAQNETLRTAATAAGALFAEQRIYLLTLMSFVAMFGIEHFVLAGRERRRDALEEERRDPTYWLHLGGYSAYAALVGYLLVERAERGLAALVLYTFAMALHFVIGKHALAEEHGRIFRAHGHWWLAGAVLVGWAAGAAMPLSEATFARLFAILAGGVVISSLNAELPDEREGRFWPFCLGALAYAGLLLMG